MGSGKSPYAKPPNREVGVVAGRVKICENKEDYLWALFEPPTAVVVVELNDFSPSFRGEAK